MDPISNIDRIAILLRQKLRERAQAAAAERTEDSAPRHQLGGLEAARAVAAIEGVDDRQRRRAFVQSILVDQFGQDMVNDAPFQQLVARVSRAIEGDDASAALLTRLINDLRSK